MLIMFNLAVYSVVLYKLAIPTISFITPPTPTANRSIISMSMKFLRKQNCSNMLTSVADEC